MKNVNTFVCWHLKPKRTNCSLLLFVSVIFVSEFLKWGMGEERKGKKGKNVK
jgi:hypothetical protein